MRPHRRYRILLAIIAASWLLPLTAAALLAAPTAAALPPASQSTAAPALPLTRTRLAPLSVIANRDWAIASRRTAGDPSVPFDMQSAAQQRESALAQAGAARSANRAPQAPGAFGGAWSSIGPDPMVLTGRGDGLFDAMAGRVSALAIRSSAPYTIYLGAAQGGIWLSSTVTGAWQPRSDALGALAIGALALAPSNEDIVYAGTGEGVLSSDAYGGDGVYRSTDAGGTFSKVSAAGYFTAASIARIAVHNTDPNTLYAATVRGSGGARATTSPAAAVPYGVWKSTDGGVTWSVVLTTGNNPLTLTGVADLIIDPQDSNIAYASVLGAGISKTVNGGLTWQTAMNGLPSGDYGRAPSRIALGISRPNATVSATLFAGFDFYSGTTHMPAAIYRSTNDGGAWTQSGTGNVAGYCGSQCWYDNAVAVDPTNPSVVYALGNYDYANGSGGIYRSTDGGIDWTDIGFNMHPAYHAIAIRRDAPANIVVGNDGGVWFSASQGGRLTPGDPPNATTWVNLNGGVDPATAAVLNRSGLAIGQFNSIAANPAVPNRYYGGTQGNGTQRKHDAENTWYDVTSRNGGQVLVDPANANTIYGTAEGISPFRLVDGGQLYGSGFTSDELITKGINAADRSDFYVPFLMDASNPERLYLGTHRVYRTGNARATLSTDVQWEAISADLTSGCAGAAPNGAYACALSALGHSAGAPALYAGTLEGWLWLSPDATAANPAWARIDQAGSGTPNRPVSAVAVDASNYRVAVAAFSGFDPATPGQPGHLYRTSNAGQTWSNISGNLPDVPVNTVVLDRSDAETIYAGTDVGPYVTTNGGATWTPLGSGVPLVAVWQMALNPFTRQLAAGTHGRGAWLLDDSSTVRAALQVRAQAAAVPVGPGSTLQYTLTVENHGNITATAVVITDPLPANTTFVAAGSGGVLSGAGVVFTVPAIAPPAVVTMSAPLGVGIVPGRASVTFTVQIANGGVVTTGSTITNDNVTVAAAALSTVTGSPIVTTLGASAGIALSPAAQHDGTRAGQSLFYTLTIRNDGYLTDTFAFTSTGDGWALSFLDASGATPVTGTAGLAPATEVHVRVRVTVPLTASAAQSATTAVRVASQSAPGVFADAAMTTTAVTRDILLVDGDDGHPDVEAFYQAALGARGLAYDYFDLRAAPGGSLPANYLNAHRVVIWFTGNSHPGPLLPYENELAAYLDGGGRLFMSGMDILDRLAGTTSFVRNYLHINWDGTEVQNDTGTFTVTGIVTSALTGGFVPAALNYTATGYLADFSDQITPIAPAETAFLDDKGLPDGLHVNASPYKVIFLAFPLEAVQGAAQRADLIGRSVEYLTANRPLAQLLVSGPVTASKDVSGTFAAAIEPISPTRPIRYTWQASDQPISVTVGLDRDARTFTWPMVGPKWVTVTASNEEIRADLSGINVVPPVASPAVGIAAFMYDPATRVLSYTLTVNHLIGETAAEIRTGTAGVNGALAHSLATPAAGAARGAVVLSATDEAALYAGGLYVSISTTANPGGETRGQIGVSGSHATQVLGVQVGRALFLPLIRR